MFFTKIRNAFRRKMVGRSGNDALNLLLLACCFVLAIISLLWSPIIVLSMVFLVLAMMRMFSKDLEARRKENQKFLQLVAPLRDRKNRYFRCPGCKQTVRVPRGKGKISIRCPQCNTRFEKET